MAAQAVWLTRDESGATRAAMGTIDGDSLMDGDVTVRVSHSTVNYKDGLAVTGKSPVVRRWPMIPGIDFAGTVETSSHPDFKAGDEVLLNGWGVGETHLGGWATIARVSGDWLIPLPKGLTAEQSMAVGTAGYTASLCLMALERHGLAPYAATAPKGALLVTGAAGGVGSIAVALAAKAGWHVIASTGRPEEADYLKRLGAAEIIERASLSSPGKPLARERWEAAIDSVGSHTLANVLAATMTGGAVAACGLAQGMDLPATVAPFILRGVALLGVNSVTQTAETRIAAWARIERDLDRDLLASMTRMVSLDEAIGVGEAIVDGHIRGRVVVRV